MQNREYYSQTCHLFSSNSSHIVDSRMDTPNDPIRNNDGAISTPVPGNRHRFLPANAVQTLPSPWIRKSSKRFVGNALRAGFCATLRLVCDNPQVLNLAGQNADHFAVCTHRKQWGCVIHFWDKLGKHLLDPTGIGTYLLDASFFVVSILQQCPLKGSYLSLNLCELYRTPPEWF